jgi:hypothetical protein
MKTLCRAALLCAIALLSIPSTTLLVPSASAAAAPADSSKPKKKSKHKNKKQKILKGRHSKHSRKPA